MHNKIFQGRPRTPRTNLPPDILSACHATMPFCTKPIPKLAATSRQLDMSAVPHPQQASVWAAAANLAHLQDLAAIEAVQGPQHGRDRIAVECRHTQLQVEGIS